jgi:pantothenate kinase-related protein Tda10
MSINQIIQYQPIINIGCLGSVSDGKSTLVANLLTSPLMYCGYFDAIFLLIGSLDDIYDDLIEKKIINKNSKLKI